MSSAFVNYYEVLGVTSSATADELRRAYRILARRYHPDVNPGKSSEERFKSIAHAYDVLSDPERRRQFDIELGGAERARNSERLRGYARAQQQQHARRRAQQRYEEYARQQSGPARRTSPEREQAAEPAGSSGIFRLLKGGVESVSSIFQSRTKERKRRKGGVVSVSILEVSVTMRDAITGIRKTVELPEEDGARKISISVPPGVRTGSVLRFRNRQDSGDAIVFVIHVANHPGMQLTQRGLIVEVPISVNEAVQGANITLPTLEEPVIVKVPPGSQSGTELRLRGKGIIDRDGARGDLFYRLMIKLPENHELREKAAGLDKLYDGQLRQGLPKTLLEW